jgi:hypothetical protein
MFRKSSLILLGNRDADHVLIEPTSKVSSGWRTANIAVKCGVWSGHYSGQFLVGELSRFGKEIEYLAEHLKPKAALNSVEHYLQMTLAQDAHGHVRVQGNARDRVGAKSWLEFDFEIDPAGLAEVANALIQADPME